MDIPLLFSKNHKLETIFEKSHRSSVILQKFLKISPTCPKFNTHKKFVVHFFIPMLLLPPTPFLIYLTLKKIKGPKTHSLPKKEVGEIFKNFKNHTTTVTFFKNGLQLLFLEVNEFLVL